MSHARKWAATVWIVVSGIFGICGFMVDWPQVAEKLPQFLSDPKTIWAIVWLIMTIAGLIVIWRHTPDSQREAADSVVNALEEMLVEMERALRANPASHNQLEAIKQEFVDRKIPMFLESRLGKRERVKFQDSLWTQSSGSLIDAWNLKVMSAQMYIRAFVDARKAKLREKAASESVQTSKEELQLPKSPD